MKQTRKSIRLPGYDYSKPGAYFVTICVKDHVHLFGSIQNSAMRENEFGKTVRTCWNDLPRHYPSIQLDAFVIMPNHIHGIVVIVDDGNTVEAGLKPAPTNKNTPKHHGLPEIIRALKTFSARRINEIRKTPGIPVWQRNYYEHIVRNESALVQIRKYIADNPANWQISLSNEFKQISGFGFAVTVKS